MQSPTYTNTRIHTIEDAHAVFYAVALQYLPKVSRRLNMEERQYIQPGSVFVWEERDASADDIGAGITRWTDGRRWGPSRTKDDFLYYHEKLPEFDAEPGLRELIISSRLIKQTYSAYIDSPTGRRKWHLVAYYTASTDRILPTVDMDSFLRGLRDDMPRGMFLTARVTTKARVDSEHREEPENRAGGSQPLRIVLNKASPSPAADMLTYPLAETHYSHSEAPADDAVPDDSGPTATRLPDPLQAQSHTVRQGPASCDLAPLIYLRTVPYPPRHPIDSVALRSLDCRMRII